MCLAANKKVFHSSKTSHRKWIDVRRYFVATFRHTNKYRATSGLNHKAGIPNLAGENSNLLLPAILVSVLFRLGWREQVFQLVASTHLQTPGLLELPFSSVSLQLPGDFSQFRLVLLFRFAFIHQILMVRALYQTLYLPQLIPVSVVGPQELI